MRNSDRETLIKNIIEKINALDYKQHYKPQDIINNFYELYQNIIQEMETKGEHASGMDEFSPILEKKISESINLSYIQEINLNTLKKNLNNINIDINGIMNRREEGKNNQKNYSALLAVSGLLFFINTQLFLKLKKIYLEKIQKNINDSFCDKEKDTLKKLLNDINVASDLDLLKSNVNNLKKFIEARLETKISKWNILLGVVTAGFITLLQTIAYVLGKDLWIRDRINNIKENEATKYKSLWSELVEVELANNNQDDETAPKCGPR